MDRRTVMTGMLGTAAASLWTPPDAFALSIGQHRKLAEIGRRIGVVHDGSPAVRGIDVNRKRR